MLPWQQGKPHVQPEVTAVDRKSEEHVSKVPNDILFMYTTHNKLVIKEIYLTKRKVPNEISDETSVRLMQVHNLCCWHAFCLR